MTREEARKFGLSLLNGIMERNESYPVYANNVRQAIEALSDQPSLPSDADEAAKQFVGYDIDTDDLRDYEIGISSFKAGAEWMKEQMLEEAVEGVVCYGSKGAYIESDFLGTYDTEVYGEPGDKVRIVVLKEEEE